MKKLFLLFAALLVAGCGEKSLSDSEVEKALKEAGIGDSLQERNGLFYQPNKSEPYSGWVKEMHDSEQVAVLVQLRDGKPHGLAMRWYDNGQKQSEGQTKDGKEDGLWTEWHANGQKAGEGTFKDGELISSKWWNNEGEQVETEEEAKGKQENNEIERLREELRSLQD